MALNRGPRIVTSGLVLCLDAANKNSYKGSGTSWLDLSGNNNTGTLTNTPTFSNTNGGNFTFNGTTQYVDCGSSATLQINVGTISAWIKTTTNDANYRAIICLQGNYGLFVKSSVLITYDWGNNIDRATATNVIDGNWKNVVMTFSNNVGTPSNNAILYVNGVSVLTTTTKFLSNSSNLLFGYGNSVNQYFNGSISNGLIYNRVLTAAEVLQNFNAVRRRFGI